MNTRQLSLLAAISFVLNLIWENLHAVFYVLPAPFLQRISICFFATLGDVAITLLLFLLWDAIRRNYFLLGILGTLIAIIIEYIALSHGWWQYAPSMPLIPFTQIGLTPVLQMALLPSICLQIISRTLSISRRAENPATMGTK